MNDEASRRQQRYQGLRRRHGTNPGSDDTNSRSTNSGTNPWMTPEGTNQPQEPTSQEPPSAANQTLEQRYASAVATMNQLVTSLDFEQLPWITDIFRATAKALDEDDPARASVLNNLGSAAQLTHRRTGEPGDLDDAATYYRAAASAAHNEDNDVVLYLSNLSLALTDQALNTGAGNTGAGNTGAGNTGAGARQPRIELASEAVVAARQAAERAPHGDARRALVLVRLGNALKTHARLAADTGSDDEFIEVFREAARISAPADRVDLLVNLGSALLRRYERHGSMDDLDEGVQQLRWGVDGLADGEPRRLALCHLANALRLRFRLIGDLADLNSAVNELLGVLDMLDRGHQLTGKVVWGLSCAIAEYIDSTGEPAPLRRALRSMDPAVRGLASRDPDRSMALAGFGAMLRRHFLHGAAANALDAAVSAGEASLRGAEPEPYRRAVRNSLVTTLITRYERSGDTADLDRAADVADEVVRLAPAEVTPAHTALAQLGVIATHRYRQNSDPEELDRSIELLDRALNAMPEKAPNRATVANHLGWSLRALHQRLGRRRPYRWARKVLTDAAEQATAPADQRLRAARLGGQLAAQAHRWSEALESFSTAVTLLPLVTRGKRIVAAPETQQRWSTIAADAAACALECGEPERAVELLEHGRGAVLADFLPNGSELGELHRTQPDLSDQAIRLRRLLDRPAQEPAFADLPDGESDERQRRCDAWESLLREVRALPGHENHLRPTPFSELSAAAGYGAVVLVNLSRYRSDALIVFGGRVLTVSLPDTSPDTATQWATTVLAASRNDQQNTMAEALDWVWHHIARPVLEQMGYLQPPGEGQRWPRLWWSVSGALAFLPLHAATALTGQSALDRVVSSYTPTLRTLAQTLRRPVPERGSPLVAAGSSERVARELPRSNRILAQYWPTAEVISTEATDIANILRALPEHPWVHICEPSAQDPAQPASSLVLDRESDHSLGIVDLGPVTLDRAEFGYLGHTRTVSDTPSAAAVSLAGELGYAGFTHVISTLWETDEDSAAEVHARVYDELFSGTDFDPDSAAHALHTAAFALRAQHPNEPVIWAAHVHVGP